MGERCLRERGRVMATRDLLEMESARGLKGLFIFINLILASISIVALLGPVWIMGYKDTPYFQYLEENHKWHWEPPKETQIMLLVFACYMHFYDLPITFLRLFKAMCNCCGCGGCLALPYAWTHILTPGMYIASLVVAMHDKWGHDYWTKAMKDKHGEYYPYYMAAALGTQVILRIFLFARMQSPHTRCLTLLKRSLWFTRNQTWKQEGARWTLQ